MVRYDRTIPPGGEGKISVEVRTEGYQGNVHKAARVTTNDPENSQVTISMKGKIWVPIQVSPGYANLVGIVGDAVETVVSLQAQKKDPLKLAVKSVSVPEKITVELVQVEKDQSYQVKIKNKIDEQTVYSGQVQLSTNYPEKPEILIRVNGNIRSVLEVRPNAINLGKMSQERIGQLTKGAGSFKRPATIILNRGNDLEIRKLELEKSLFTATIKNLHPGRIFHIVVEPDFEKLVKGKNEDRLRIYTNQRGNEIVEIPLTLEIL